MCVGPFKLPYVPDVTYIQLSFHSSLLCTNAKQIDFFLFFPEVVRFKYSGDPCLHVENLSLLCVGQWTSQ